MTALEVYDIIRQSSEFSKDCIFNTVTKGYSIAVIQYKIGDTIYDINISSSNKFIYFYLNTFTLDIKSIESTLVLLKCNNKTIITFFKKFLKQCSKLDYYIKVKELDKIKLKPIINKHLKKFYNNDIEIGYYSLGLFHENYILLNFQKTINIKNTRFDVTKEKFARYNIDVHFMCGDVCHILNFIYYDKLILQSKTEDYIYQKNDITKIIRKERLINLMKND